MNIRVALRIQDVLVIDKAQTVCMNYMPDAKFIEEGPCLCPDSLDWSFADELEHQSQYLLVHPAYSRGQKAAF